MLTNRLKAASFGAAIAIASLPAQTQSGGNTRFIPQNSAVVVRIASPAKWRDSFGMTQAAKLMQGQALSPLMEQAAMMYDMTMDELRQSGEFDADLLQGLLEQWKGDIVLSAQLDWAGFAEAVEYDEVPPMSLVVALTPDGEYDFDKFAAEFSRMAEEAPRGDELRDFAVGDLTLRRIGPGADSTEPDFTLPHVIDGHLVLLGGTSLDDDAAKLIATEDRWAASTGTGPLYMRADLGGLMATMMDSMGDGPEAEMFDVIGMMEMLGLGAIGSMSMSLDVDGQHVVGDFTLGMKPEKRGLLNIFKNSNQAPRLLSSIPANAESFSVTAMDLKPVYDTVVGIWTEMEDFVPMTLDEVMEGFTEATKVRLKEDLIDHLGAEILMVQDVEAVLSMDPDDIEDNWAAMFNGMVYGIALNDGAAFGKSLETALRSRGMHVGRKTEEYGGVKVNRMRIAGLIELEYVVTNDVLLLALGGGEGTQRALRGVLDTRAAGENELPEALRKHVAAMQPGWNGVSMSPLAASMAGAANMIMASGELGEDGEMVSAVLQGLGADMKRLGIDMVVSTTYVDDNGMTARFRW